MGSKTYWQEYIDNIKSIADRVYKNTYNNDEIGFHTIVINDLYDNGNIQLVLNNAKTYNDSEKYIIMELCEMLLMLPMYERTAIFSYLRENN